VLDFEAYKQTSSDSAEVVKPEVHQVATDLLEKYGPAFKELAQK
jgi:hypothetical protein